MNNFLLSLQPLLALLAADPFIRSLQIGVLIAGSLLVYLVFWTTKDSINRSNSFIFILFSIVLVAFIPFVGFLCYLLIRPSKTLTEKNLLQAVADLKTELATIAKNNSEVKKILVKPSPKHVIIHKKQKKS